MGVDPTRNQFSGANQITPYLGPDLFSNISEDIIAYVLSFLDKGEICQVAATNQRLYTIATSNEVWRPILRRAFPGSFKEDEPAIQTFKKRKLEIHSNLINEIYSIEELVLGYPFNNFVPIGKQQFILIKNNELWFYSPEFFRKIKRFNHKNEQFKLIPLENNQVLVGYNHHAKVDLLNLATGKITKTFIKGNEKNYLLYAFSTQSGKLICCHKYGETHVWELEQRKVLSTFKIGKGLSHAILMNQKYLITGHRSGNISVWDFNSSNQLVYTFLAEENQKAKKIQTLLCCNQTQQLIAIHAIDDKKSLISVYDLGKQKRLWSGCVEKFLRSSKLLNAA
jgi:WD40 repeat protein